MKKKITHGIEVVQAPPEHLAAVQSLATACIHNARAIEAAAQSLRAQVAITNCNFTGQDTAITIK